MPPVEDTHGEGEQDEGRGEHRLELDTPDGITLGP